MTRKKFKTVHGYLRSTVTALGFQQAKDELAGRQPMSDDDVLRLAVHNLLPQFGITDRINLQESLREGVKRLRAAATGDRQIVALDAVTKWLVRNTEVCRPVRRNFIGAQATTSSITFAANASARKRARGLNAFSAGGTSLWKRPSASCAHPSTPIPPRRRWAIPVQISSVGKTRGD